MTQRETSLPSGARLAAFFDEIEKIAEDPKPKKEEWWKRRLKQGAGYALGYAAGHGTGMLLHHAVKNKIRSWPHASKVKYLAPLLGASTAIVMAANEYAASRMAKHE